MKCSFVGRLVSCCLFLFLSLSAFAQADEAHAERAYDYFAAGQGDSLYAMCTPTMQEKVTPAVLGGMMAVDFGGPVNKAAYLFGTVTLGAGQERFMAAVMLGTLS